MVNAQLPADLQSQLVRHGHVLIIGVWQYREWQQIDSVQPQIAELASGLRPHFASIQFLPNPTVAKLGQTLHEFFSVTGDSPDDRLFVYYMGHGFTDTTSGMGFITGVDTPSYDPDNRRAVRNAISMRDYDSYSRNSRAPQVLTVFDSCFAGTIFSAALGPALRPTFMDYQRVRSALRHPIRYYITAGGPNEEVPADFPFAKVLLRGIEGAAGAGDGFVTGQQLGPVGE